MPHDFQQPVFPTLGDGKTPPLIIPEPGDMLARMRDDKSVVPPAAALVSASYYAGCIVIRADGRAVLNLRVPLALELMARIASACKDAIKGRP